MTIFVGGSGINIPARASREPVSEWWWYPASPDARNVEFEEDSLPAGFQWWDDVGGAGPLIAHAAVNNVPLTVSSSPATFARYKVNNQRRRSWLQVQVPQIGGGGLPYTAASVYLLRPITLGADDCFWTRFSTVINWLSSGSGVQGPNCNYVVMGSAAGIPDRSTGITIGLASQASQGGNVNGLLQVYNAGAQTTIPIGAFSFSQGGSPGFGLRRRSSTNWTGFFFGAEFYREVNEFTQASIGGAFATFAPTHIGWKFRADLGQGFNPIFSVDFDRYTADANALPL